MQDKKNHHQKLNKERRGNNEWIAEKHIYIVQMLDVHMGLEGEKTIGSTMIGKRNRIEYATKLLQVFQKPF